MRGLLCQGSMRYHSSRAGILYGNYRPFDLPLHVAYISLLGKTPSGKMGSNGSEGQDEENDENEDNEESMENMKNSAPKSRGENFQLDLFLANKYPELVSI